MVHDAEHRGLEDLGFDKRTFHDDDRLVREHDLAFTHCIYLSGELHG